MKKLIFLLLFSLPVLAQTEFEVPQDVKLKKKSDFAKYEPDVINAAKWLEEADWSNEVKHKQVNAFLMQWITGSPSVTVEVGAPLTKLTKNNANLLVVFMASYTRNYLENKDTATKITATKAGLVSMIRVYQKGVGVEDSSDMNVLAKMEAQGMLDDYIKKEF